MDISAYKLGLLQQLLQVENESLLKKIGQLIEQEQVVAWTVDGQPLTSSQYDQHLAKGKEQALSGNSIPSDQLKQNLEGWKEKYSK